jgi:hypothetical protein
MISTASDTRRVGSRVQIPVPWKRADALQARLATHGISATACFDPLGRTAGIEVPADADVTTVHALLGGSP